jgi:putative oxidoreductase
MHDHIHPNGGFLVRAHHQMEAMLNRVPPSVTRLLLRWGLAGVFWTSARTKVDGLLTVSDSAKYLFAEEYRLPLIDTDLAAHLATYAEHAFALSLILGLATRLSAFGIIVMTLVIQLFVYPDAFLGVHLGWFAMAFAIVTSGPGAISLDHLLRTRFVR